MFSSVEMRPIKIACDAPAYEVVKVSGRAGMRSPEDVRWRHQSLPQSEVSRQKSLVRRLWRLLFAFGTPEVEETCGCGKTLPERRFLLLRTRAGTEVRYSLAQCGHCRTIHWDKEQTSTKPSSSGRRRDA